MISHSKRPANISSLVSSPDKRMAACPGKENTVEIYDSIARRYLSTYYGHQEGMYHLVGDRVEDVTWESDTVVVSRSSSGATHRWDTRSGVHLGTLTVATILKGKESRHE